MNTYYVATLSGYVLVEAADERQARESGQAAMQADLRKQLGREVPVSIRTVRLATEDEIKFQNWHNEMVANERQIAAAWN